MSFLLGPGLFSGAMLNFGRVIYQQKINKIFIYIGKYTTFRPLDFDPSFFSWNPKAYINIYKKVTVTAPGQTLGTTDAAGSSEDVKMEASGYWSCVDLCVSERMVFFGGKKLAQDFCWNQF